MKNQGIQFQIIDHRKNKRVPDWANAFLSSIKSCMQPYNIVGIEVVADMKSIANATKTIIGKLEQQSKKRWMGISPDVKFDRENKSIRIFNSYGNLLFEILEKKESTIYGYARVSTKKQSLKMQLEELKKFGCDKIIQEKVSALADRPQFDELLNSLNKGDTLVVWKLDRLGRSMLDLIKIIADLDTKGVNFVSITENINTDSTTGKMMLMLFSMMAEYELSIRKERQEANKEIARQSGRLGGRPKGLSRDAKKTAVVLMGMYREKDGEEYKYSVSEITAALKISRGTVYKYLAYMNVPKRGTLNI